MSITLATFGAVDWTVLVLYLLGMVAIGAVVGRKQHDTDDYFLAGRRMPTWAVALSMLATTLSAATFIGAPQEAFTGDLSYLILNIGGVIAVVIVAAFFIPAFYRAGTVTVYGYLGQRFGPGAMVASSVAFLGGRLLASGSRLFMAAIGFSLILYGDLQPAHLVTAIVILGAIGTIYTACGGIRAVIWTDTIQIVVMIGAAVLSIYLLLDAIPLTTTQIIDALGDPQSQVNGHSKAQIVNTEWSISQSYTIWTGAFAIVFFNIAAFGTDQDMVQRILTCKSSWRGSASLIVANLISIPVVLLFMVIGLLLFIYYSRPDLMGTAAPVETLDDSRKIFPQFLLHKLPEVHKGLAGLAMAGLFAAAMSSLDSAINAMASSAIADLYLPWKRRHPDDTATDQQSLTAPRLTVVAMGTALTIFAVGAALTYNEKEDTLISFALSVMMYAYAGLLGVFLTAILTRRGNTSSVIAALLVGAGVILTLKMGWLQAGLGWMQGFASPAAAPDSLAEPPPPPVIAWPWWMVIAAAASFLTCYLGSPRPLDQGSAAQPPESAPKTP